MWLKTAVIVDHLTHEEASLILLERGRVWVKPTEETDEANTAQTQNADAAAIQKEEQRAGPTPDPES